MFEKFRRLYLQSRYSVWVNFQCEKRLEGIVNSKYINYQFLDIYSNNISYSELPNYFETSKV